MENLILEDYGVQEMNAEEIKEVNGGIIPAIIAAGVTACGAAWFIGEKVGRTLYHQFN